MWYIHVKYSLNREISYVVKQHKLFTIVFISENQMLHKAARMEQWFWRLKAGERGGAVKGEVFRHACGETVLEICCTVVSQQLCCTAKDSKHGRVRGPLARVGCLLSCGFWCRALPCWATHQLRSNTATQFALCEWETGEWLLTCGSEMGWWNCSQFMACIC